MRTLIFELAGPKLGGTWVAAQKKHGAMMKPLLTVSAFTIALAVPALAAAQQAPSGNAQQNASCPPGSWFCADTQQQPAAPAGQPVQPLQPSQQVQPLQPLPSDEEYEPQPAQPPAQRQPGVTYAPAPQPPVVVYQPPPPVMVVRPENPPPYVYTPPPRPLVRRSEWGLNLHLAGLTIGRGTRSDQGAGMGAVGAGLRYRPVPGFALEGDVDFAGGRDYQGFKRNETALGVNGLVFLNPRSRAQIYLLAGFGWSRAHVVDDSAGYDAATNDYNYFGGQAGIGFEARLSRSVAFNLDLRGFVRGRTDDGAQSHPEFTDASTGRTTNTSGGGMVTAGLTFYF
jgi:hypothetical protein